MFTTVPPGPPVIYNERGIIVETSLGPYNEGVELILTCSVSGGKSLYSKKETFDSKSLLPTSQRRRSTLGNSGPNAKS